MEFDEDNSEWYIQGFDEFNQHAKKIHQTADIEEPKKMLAMGFNDDEERKFLILYKNFTIFNSYFISLPVILPFKIVFSNNDIQLSMILDMNTQPKNVYFSYDEPKKVKKGIKMKK